MPAFHHTVLGPLGGDRQAVKLAGKTDGKIADIDHFLHFTEAFRSDLANLDRNQAAERPLGGAQLFAQQTAELAALRRRNGPPFEESLVCRIDRRLGVRDGMLFQFADFLACDR